MVRTWFQASTYAAFSDSAATSRSTRSATSHRRIVTLAAIAWRDAKRAVDLKDPGGRMRAQSRSSVTGLAVGATRSKSAWRSPDVKTPSDETIACRSSAL